MLELIGDYKLVLLFFIAISFCWWQKEEEKNEFINEKQKRGDVFCLIWMHLLRGAYNAYWYTLYMHKFRGSILDSFYKCFVIIKKGEIVEPLFDFDDTKILLLWFLIKLLSVSKMNLTPKAKVSLRMLKIQHPGLVIRILEVVIRISISKSIFEGEKVKFSLVIQIPKVVIRIPIPKSVFGGEKVNFGLVIRIIEIVIQILILERFFNNEK